MKNMKLIAILASVVLIFGFAANGLAADTLKLGVAGPHSGDLASYGIPTVKAAELVVKEINAAGGIMGKQVELVVEDDVCKPEVATNTATKLVSEDVKLVIGHICSGATKAALGIYKDAGVVVMSPSATNPGLTQSGDYPNFYRTIASDDAQAQLMVKFATEKLNVKKVAVLHDKGDYGKGQAELSKQYFEAAGVEVALYEGVTPGAVDYTAVVQKIKKNKVDLVTWGGYHPEASKIVTLMQKKKVKAPFMGPDGIKDESFIKVAGKYAEGSYVSGPMDTSTNPLTVKATKAHQDAHGADPGAFYLNAYAATLAMLNAVEKAGSTDYDAVTKALKNEFVETPLGKIKFDEKGDAIGVGFSMYRVQDGVFKEIK